MSPHRARARAERLSLLVQLPLLVWLVILWLLLWGHVTVISVLSGIVLALLVTRVFYLPPVELSGRFDIRWAFILLGHFAADLVRASFQVAVLAFDWRRVPTNSVIAVHLHTRSDFVMTLTAEVVSLVPGSIVVEADRERSILYLHALGTETREDVEHVRTRTLQVESRIVYTLGTPDDVWRVNRERRESGREPLLQTRTQREHELVRDRDLEAGLITTTGEELP
ncbi:Na+/H+ antiporter subunit E [Clavibacter lycopersici]|uniref:Na+/H+ antiporter subunit E n=1 Tax=Clavibacter lycopersici TaxID=2301718 RepID=A0A399T8X7_9MICO|nr:Na+/H+ antiporter subunit E [Clavibacter lycopersici]RIJ51619.1 Na+/H+ antiporter subunit E [Clavibacter lycopersici]RIJ61689.1 Na+/H+ antiporter subunit E [Clavibacter lycopersici]